MSLYSQADFKTETFHELVLKKQRKYLAKKYDEPCPCLFGDKVLKKFKNFIQ